MLLHMQGILALTQHGMHHQKSAQAESQLADLCLTGEKQAALMARLLTLREQKLRDEQDRFDMVVEYAGLWDKHRRGRATKYERRKVEAMSEAFGEGDRKAVVLGGEVEIEDTVEELKGLAVEFRGKGLALRVEAD